MSVRITPEPSPEDAEAVLAALAAGVAPPPDAWAEAALAEGVEQDEPDP